MTNDTNKVHCNVHNPVYTPELLETSFWVHSRAKSLPKSSTYRIQLLVKRFRIFWKCQYLQQVMGFSSVGPLKAVWHFFATASWYNFGSNFNGSIIEYTHWAQGNQNYLSVSVRLPLTRLSNIQAVRPPMNILLPKVTFKTWSIRFEPIKM